MANAFSLSTGNFSYFIVYGCLCDILVWVLTFGQGKLKCSLLLKVAACSRIKRTACRDITRLIRRTPGTTLDIPIDVCLVTVKLRKPLRRETVWWPILRMDSWCKFFLEKKPQLLLAGHTVDGDWPGTFLKFWNLYKKVDGTHPIYESGYDLSGCVPIYVHGDEGRGQLKRPYMVVSWQNVIGFGGMEKCNDTSYLVYKLPKTYSSKTDSCNAYTYQLTSHMRVGMALLVELRHSFTTRWLFTGISSHLYYDDWTLDDLLGELAKQAIDAYENGICDPYIQ